MRTTHVAAMMRSRMRPDEGQFERKITSNFATSMCVARSIQVISAANGP